MEIYIFNFLSKKRNTYRTKKEGEKSSEKKNRNVYPNQSQWVWFCGSNHLIVFLSPVEF
jgi:hypothetical protein